jgi:hypothetical protein
MFWDIILDPVRNSLSNDILRWMIAATLPAVVITRATFLAVGSSIASRQELKFGIALYILLVGVFYLP